MGKEQFIGSWKLLSSEYWTSDGEVIYPMGKEVTGRLMYSPDGYMSVQHMMAHREPFASSDWLRGTPAEFKAAFESYRAYYGTWEVDEKKGAVTHHIEAGSFPNWYGTDFVRFYEITGNRLTLRATPQLMDGKTVTVYLIWEKLNSR